ncbi:hypothetical protein GCM10009785_32800 [Brooklawnia cerclae]|uniref:1-deoxy-D-xylulose 5-phosphate reductoisomerase n=1 Tax=Brooklawnia cerclae TaxID=349934 RepID=A0ABX0SGA3_9ACTN|nr:hypothetical protein [Brooklawnia cerclae]NIH57425.1 1-deoxy-D-xylulose 5-phosphate reductoisomerase [Brooklawnia cerclae]
MQSVVIVGAEEPLGKRVLELIGSHRDEFMVDGLVSQGSQPRELAELVWEFTPLLVGIADEYAEGAFRDQLEDIALDKGMVDWELPEFDVVAGEGAAERVAALGCDVLVDAAAGRLRYRDGTVVEAPGADQLLAMLAYRPGS